MTSSRLRPLFARTLRASLASPLVLAGCAGGVDLAGYATPACDDNQLAVRGLSPALPPDLVQLRGLTEVGGPESFQRVLSSEGTACATASNPETCRSTLASLTSREGFGRTCLDICNAYYLATTRGDEVAAHDSLDALKAFLGPIDTTQEAVLLVLAQGYKVACGSLEYGAVKAGTHGAFQVIATQGFACGEGTKVDQFVLEVSKDGTVKELHSEVLARGSAGCAVGRRPGGLRDGAPVACEGTLGRYFAETAHLEAASILAFLRLHEELALHGADASLRDAALASALDEVLHTEASTRLAHRFGATPRRPDVSPEAPRSLFAMALDNAVEGCTRETYGALVAHHQALHAEDDEVRTALARIAEDETRHAELSWDIERWALTRLSAAERVHLQDARRQAIAVLRDEVALPLDPELVTRAGLPTPHAAAALLSSLERELWA